MCFGKLFRRNKSKKSLKKESNDERLEQPYKQSFSRKEKRREKDRFKSPIPGRHPERHEESIFSQVTNLSKQLQSEEQPSDEVSLEALVQRRNLEDAFIRLQWLNHENLKSPTLCGYDDSTNEEHGTTASSRTRQELVKSVEELERSLNQALDLANELEHFATSIPKLRDQIGAMSQTSANILCLANTLKEAVSSQTPKLNHQEKN